MVLQVGFTGGDKLTIPSWWFSFNLLEEYARQIGNLPQIGLCQTEMVEMPKL